MYTLFRPASLLALLLALAGVGCAEASQRSVAPSSAETTAVAEKPMADKPMADKGMGKKAMNVLHSGAFRQAEAPVKGSFQIRREGGRTLLVLSDDFRTKAEAPDLKVTIGRDADPLAMSRPPAYPLKEGRYTVIAPLKAASGGQVYELPAGLDLTAQGSVIIWCEQFNATMAWAPLGR